MLSRVWFWLNAPRGKMGVRPLLAAFYLLAGAALVTKLSEYYIPEYGFTYLLGQGDERLVDFDWIEERDVTVFRHFRSLGYDAQYYAQLAIDPSFQDPTLAVSIDNLPYRARRILLPVTAYLLGLGQPNWVLNVYALQNVVCWFLLGWLLLRWFPPTDWDRTFRWLGLMLSAGLWFSVFLSLVDGPSLLLLALGLRWIEQGAPGRSTAILALGGLAKETNLLATAALFRLPGRSLRGWVRVVGQGILVVLPLVIWLAVLRWRLAANGSLAGSQNFDWPLVAYWDRWVQLASPILDGTARWKFHAGALATHISISVQAIFLLAWWQWRQPAWRLSVPFAVLTFMLGFAVWEGYPGASGRVLLPMLLGFNLLLPRGRRWWPVLLLGNLTMFLGPVSPEPRPRGIHSVQIVNPEALEDHRAESISIHFPRPWYRTEENRRRQWRWAEADADIVIHNPYPWPVECELRGEWSAQVARTARLSQDAELLWQQDIDRQVQAWRIAGIVIRPGENRLRIESDRSSTEALPGDDRQLTVCLIRFALKGRILAPLPPATP